MILLAHKIIFYDNFEIQSQVNLLFIIQLFTLTIQIHN